MPSIFIEMEATELAMHCARANQIQQKANLLLVCQKIGHIWNYTNKEGAIANSNSNCNV